MYLSRSMSRGKAPEESNVCISLASTNQFRPNKSGKRERFDAGISPLVTWCRFLVLVGVFFVPIQQLNGQLPGQKSASPAASKQDVGKAPDPEEVILETKDGVKLVCTYYGPPESEEDPELGKTVIPFILLHDWEGKRRQLHLFGAFLQSRGHAVIIPDFRGHGDSIKTIGGDKEINFAKFRRNEITSATLDIERCKKFLVKRNNEGKLNIDLLCVVAVGKSSALAAQWTLNDWFAFPSVNTDGIKQGQDVKAVVLVSPRKKLGSSSILQSFANPLFSGARGDPMPLMIVWCPDDEKSAKDTKSLIAGLEKTRSESPQDADQAETKESLFVVPVKRETVSGIQMMNTERVKGLWDFMETVIVKRIRAKLDQRPWMSRAIPIDEDEEE